MSRTAQDKTQGLWELAKQRPQPGSLLEEPRAGGSRTIADVRVEEVITKTLETTPTGPTHLSRRLMARRVGLTLALLPLRLDRVERRTYDYTRHGTTTLFETLSVRRKDRKANGPKTSF